MLDRRDRGTWGGRRRGRGRGERGLETRCFSTKGGEKVVARVALLFFILCLLSLCSSR